MNGNPKGPTAMSLITAGFKEVLKQRNEEYEKNPPKSKFLREPLQPAFKFHMNQYNPPLALDTGSNLNSQSNGVRYRRMDDLESVTTRDNVSVVYNHNTDLNLDNIDNVRSGQPKKINNERMSRLRISGTRTRRSLPLPIHKHEFEIMQEIVNNQTLVIEGSTGCGKSTQIPQFILDYACNTSEAVNIVVTQPRRIAAISLAMHVASERNWEVGSHVGYQVGLDRKCSNDTVITYVTTGVLLEQLIHNQCLTDYTHIILDEVHERDVDMDLLLSVVKDLLIHDTKTKVILMSATVVAEKFSCYFSKQIDPKTLNPLPGSIYKVNHRLFEVNEHFLDDLPGLGICQDAPAFHEISTTPKLCAELKEIVYQLLMYITYKEMIEARCQDVNFLHMGSVLVFLPGLNEITELNEYLLMGANRESCVNPRKRDLFTNAGQSAAIFPLRIDDQSCIANVLKNPAIQKVYQETFYLLALHSSIGISEQRRAFDNPQVGRRKIILSTNIAESSITVKDIRYVIDLCMIKRLRYDRETHFSSLQTEWASKSSCEQRKGRAGRVHSGELFRLVSKDVYAQFDDYCPPEILTGPLTQVILRIKEFGREPRSLLQRALDCPSIEDIGYTFLALKEAGALSIRREEVTKITTNQKGEQSQVTHVVMPVDDHWQGELTFIGRLTSALPMDLHMGKLIALGYAFDVLEESIIIAACLTVSRSIFSQPFFSGRVKNNRLSKAPNQTKVLDAFEKKLRLSEGKHSDMLTMLNAFKLWYTRTKTGAFRSQADERKWCDDLYLDPQALREIEILTNEIKRRLKERFNILVLDFSQLDKRNEDEEAFFDPNENQVNHLNSLVFSKSFRTFLLQMAIAGAFYPNYFIRGHNTFIEDDAQRLFDGLDPFQCVEIGNLPMDEGYLYRDRIASHFKDYCMKYSTEMPIVVCRNTKGIIKFPDNFSNRYNMFESQGSRSANMSVILALRMGQLSSLRPKIPLYELSHEEKSRLKQLVDAENIKENKLLPLNYKYLAGPKNHVGYPSVECSYIRVYVTYAKECGMFYGIYEDDKEREQDLFAEISSYVTSRKRQRLESSLIGDYCLAPFESEYYRAEIISKRGEIVTVYFVDYGNTNTVHQNEIYELPEVLMKTCPFLAVKFSLSEIKPSTAYHADGQWNSKDRDVFFKYINAYTNTPLGCKVFSVVDNVVRVRVQMVDHNNKILNEELIIMGIAEYAEESFSSRQDNTNRVKFSNKRQIDLFSSESSVPKTRFVKSLALTASDSDDDLEDLEMDDKSLTRELNNLLDSVKHKASAETITLSAPHHPYLMKFHGVTESSKRPVTVAPDSTCSILIEPEPQNHLTRLMVAGCVQSCTTNEQGHDLMLRHVTLMPYIPGLPFIMALIFTPSAELITDSHRTRYVGARCGLGVDSEGRPLHPSNDMDIRTDVRFDESDIKSINGIRGLLNMTLGSTTHSQDVMERYQSGIKKFLAALFLKHNRDLVNNEIVGEYSLSSAFADLDQCSVSNRTDVNRIFITHISVEGVARNIRWTRSPILGDPRTERAKADWIKRFQDAIEDNFQNLNAPLTAMTRIKMSRDVLPEIKICEICSQNPEFLKDKMRLGVALLTETEVEAHLASEQHHQNVLQVRNLLKI